MTNGSNLRAEVPLDVADRVRGVCAGWPGVVEEAAWTGVRWRVGRAGFAHLVMISKGWPPACARAAGSVGPLCVLTLRIDRGEVLERAQPNSPYFAPAWGTRWTPSVLGVRLGHDFDWGEVAELIELAYRLVAPTRVVKRLDERDPGGGERSDPELSGPGLDKL